MPNGLLHMGGSVDVANSIQQTRDGGYIVAGSTESFGAGGIDIDFWVLKLGQDGTIGALGTSCSFGNTSISGINTNATGIILTLSPANTTAIPIDSSSTVINTSAAQNLLCTVPPPTTTTTTTTRTTTTTTICECPPNDSIPPKGCISGVVKEADTGVPLTKKLVILKRAFPTRPGIRRKGQIDNKGCYRFTNLPDGKYHVEVFPCTGGGTETVKVTGGEKVNGVDFKCR